MKLFKLLGRRWLPLVVVTVVAVGVVAVAQVRTRFGGESAHLISTKGDDTEPFTPKFVTYEVDGEPGATADINYLDLDVRPQRVDRVVLPWSVTLSTNVPGVFPSLLAQGTGSSIECRISVDHKLRDQRTSAGFNAMTFCVVKSA
ncbi:MmpS5 protein [Mycobacteroides abscessus subsp. massiliense]|uniref:MmpS family transport accessory protein n=1 Tax=Mycobacteroides abscessus TaxID=36809 RepID=UPI0009CD22DE|nr:MmpS family transport accessory protein [Mycobacteroides abscessus]SKF86975.1 MmpS5 protein [Mycobacteroides abscessus subsp. massiliense]SKG51736.1 MmpS5 protein [Mycobacteroides abscessus subsp. massiliense]SKI92807.1 MmpS5 protein [Mycobacteroides abscessus subsp. massiliense]SKJ55599.1 MmpS5 protein [Mycobacteroides abscessus subsp. massiliense]SKL19108.1 MmpS5 protein [Mycobacteroides abscessus subsp. massiliense]